MIAIIKFGEYIASSHKKHLNCHKYTIKLRELGLIAKKCTAMHARLYTPVPYF